MPPYFELENIINFCDVKLKLYKFFPFSHKYNPLYLPDMLIIFFHSLQCMSTTESDRPLYPGAKSKFTEKLEFLLPETVEGLPVYRVLDRRGNIIDASQDPKVFANISYITTFIVM